ncbi:hypothetical protein [Streptomyces sp. 135]|uniref:hypothetical protein n=1 Tax=Streptomyces sp. 135 TaxID=2838850 RepID=UPI001CC12FBF|nr:hypothetical protein [Streptomyces sp. 135]
MAEATRTEKVITSTEVTFTLTLNQAERDYLRGVLGPLRPSAENGANMDIFRALDNPKYVPAEDEEPQTFRAGDRVTVQVGARSADGDRVNHSGPATVINNVDDDGDHYVRFSGGEGAYVLARYLRNI